MRLRGWHIDHHRLLYYSTVLAAVCENWYSSTDMHGHYVFLDTAVRAVTRRRALRLMDTARR
jgi:hypothetical protein